MWSTPLCIRKGKVRNEVQRRFSLSRLGRRYWHQWAKARMLLSHLRVRRTPPPPPSHCQRRRTQVKMSVVLRLRNPGVDSGRRVLGYSFATFGQKKKLQPSLHLPHQTSVCVWSHATLSMGSRGGPRGRSIDPFLAVFAAMGGDTSVGCQQNSRGY